MILKIGAVCVLAACSAIYYAENSICQSVACMKEQYEVGDKICYYTTDSYGLGIQEQNVGSFARTYFSLKQHIVPQIKTIVSNADERTIALLEGGAHLPFTKNVYDGDEGCTVVTEQ